MKIRKHATSQSSTTQFADLPTDLKQAIASYLDTHSLSFFAQTSKENLHITNSLLITHQAKLLQAPLLNFKLYTERSICHTPQNLYVCGAQYAQVVKPLERFTKFKLNAALGKVFQIQTTEQSIFILTEQGLYAFGYHFYGLGLGDKDKRDSWEKFSKVENLPLIHQIVAGPSHTFLVTEEGLYANGSNSAGELGLGHTETCYTFNKVEGFSASVQQIILGLSNTFILTNQGLFGCGKNIQGQLGLGHRNRCNTLTEIKNLPGKLLQIASGYDHTLALTDQGLYLAGWNRYYKEYVSTELNTSFTKMENLPGKVKYVWAGDTYSFILTEQGLFVGGIDTTQQIKCIRSKDAKQPMPFTKVAIPGEVLQVIPGDSEVLVVTSEGVFACGNNKNNKLGLDQYDDESENCSTFEQIVNLPTEVKHLFSLYRHIDQLKQIKKAPTLKNNKK